MPEAPDENANSLSNRLGLYRPLCGRHRPNLGLCGQVGAEPVHCLRGPSIRDASDCVGAALDPEFVDLR